MLHGQSYMVNVLGGHECYQVEERILHNKCHLVTLKKLGSTLTSDILPHDIFEVTTLM